MENLDKIKKEIENKDDCVYLDLNKVLEVSLQSEKNINSIENDEYIMASLFKIESERDSLNTEETGLKNWIIENGAYVNTSNMNTKKPNLKISEKPHQCIVCSKNFSRRDHLRRHEQSHTGLQPFECELCHKKFNRIDRLTRHKLIHSRIYSFQCDLCSKIFSRKDHLTTHRNIHIRNKTYLCNFCNKTFSRKDHLNNHKKCHS